MTAPNPPALNGNRATVFVVDDDSSLRRALARLIHSAGWKVDTYASAQDFLDGADCESTGCIVLDVQMPGMTGPELHAQMAARGISLPVIYLTAHGNLHTGVEAMKNGAVDFLVKPVDSDTLLDTVRHGIERHAAEQTQRRQREDIETRLARLSPREREVMTLVVNGHLNKQIADRLGISLKTVKVHRARVMKKVEVKSVAALVHLCEAAGIASGIRHA